MSATAVELCFREGGQLLIRSLISEKVMPYSGLAASFALDCREKLMPYITGITLSLPELFQNYKAGTGEPVPALFVISLLLQIFTQVNFVPRSHGYRG